MTEREFENYLVLMGKMLRLDESQREAISDELDDHLEQRLEELISRGMEHADAIRTALEELGDAAGLASRFTQVSRNSKRRWAMRMTMGGLATAAIVMMAFSLWGPADNGVTPDQAVAQRVHDDNTIATGPLKEIQGAWASAEVEHRPQSADSRTMALLSESIDAEYEAVPLEEFLHDFAVQTNVQTYLNRREAIDMGWDEGGSLVTLSLKGVPAEMVLELVLDDLRLTYRLQNGVIIVTSPAEAARRLDTHVYDVRDFAHLSYQGADNVDVLARVLDELEASLESDPEYRQDNSKSPKIQSRLIAAKILSEMAAKGKSMTVHSNADYESLIQLIQVTIDSESWTDNGGTGSVTAYRGRLVISQTSTVHQKIEKLLADLRKGNGPNDVVANASVGTLETWPSIPAAVPKTLPTPDNTDPLAP